MTADGRPLPAARPRLMGIGLLAALLLIALVRIVGFGWAPIAADDARYLFVGLSVWHGDGPLTASGSLFLVRSPVYPVVLATGSTLVGGDPLVGARVVALVLLAACLGVALRLGCLLGGLAGAVGTALAIGASPLVWRLVPTLRIDLPQTACVLAVVLAAWNPTVRRWALAGLAFGVTILLKETALPLVVLPLSLVGLVAPRRAATLAAVYLGAAAVVATWWWVVVWMDASVIFPLNGLAVVADRDVARSLSPGRFGLALGLASILAWCVVAIRARSSLGPRLLVAAAVGLLPAALIAMTQGLDARNYAGLAVLSAIALGVAGAAAVAEARVRPRRRRVAAAATAAIVIVAAGGVVVGQVVTDAPPPPGAAEDLARWLRSNSAPGDRIAMSFRDREATAVRLFGQVRVDYLNPVRVAPGDDPASYLWMGLRDHQLFGYPRTSLSAVLTEPPVRYVALSGPHPFHPAELIAAVERGQLPGLRLATTLTAGTDRADILAVDQATLSLDRSGAPIRLSVNAALAWLDLAAPVVGDNVAMARLIAADPVLSGTAAAGLLARFGACAVPGDAPIDGWPATFTLATGDACPAPAGAP
jgi:hypothetical protein